VYATTGTSDINGGLGAKLCQTDRAVVLTMDYFDTYLRGRQFAVITDHKPLETQSKRQNKTMNRLTEAFLKYNFVIKHT
jgi:hypothetical protein